MRTSRAAAFILDAGRPWEDAPVYGLQKEVQTNGLGERRATIFRHVEAIKGICEERINSAAANRDLLPEDLELLPESHPKYVDKAASLKQAADYLYDGLWKDICSYFGFNLTDVAGHTTRCLQIFAASCCPRGAPTRSRRAIRPPRQAACRFHGSKAAVRATE